MESSNPHVPCAGQGLSLSRGMAVPASATHEHAARFFELFCAVIPKFSSAANQQTKTYRENEELRIPYVLFEAELMFLGFRQTSLAQLMSKDTSIEVRNAFLEQLTNVLDMLESMIPRELLPKKQNIGKPTISSYPMLEGVRLGTISCNTFVLSPTSGDLYATVSCFSDCTKILNQLCKDVSEVAPTKPPKRLPPFERTRELAMHLYHSISRHWKCECNSCQDCMLYLQAHGRAGASRLNMDFRMLFTKSGPISQKWFDSIVTVSLPDELNTATTLIPTYTNGVPDASNLTFKSICLALPRSNLSVLNLDIHNGIVSKKRPPPNRAMAANFERALSLEDIMRMSLPLPPKLRRILAVVLAHSALQLYGTQWLSDSWSTASILFMQTNKNQIIPRPLISTQPREKYPTEAALVDDTEVAHSNLFVLSLGIILLELWFGKHITALRNAADLSPDGEVDPNTDFFTAQRLWEESEWEMSTRYRNAVGACVNWEFQTPDQNTKSTRLCELLYDKVVSPIEDQLAEEFNANICDLDDISLRLGGIKEQGIIPLSEEQPLGRNKRIYHAGSMDIVTPKRGRITEPCEDGQARSFFGEPDDIYTPHLDPSSFKVAVICALGTESNAVIGVFDEVYASIPEEAQRDQNGYTTGRIGEDFIVVAHLPGMGKVHAANTAGRLKSTFPNVELCLVVGVCGGAPYNGQTKKDIVLGDVIISTGLKQIDFGRRYPNGLVPKDDPEDNFGRPSEGLRSFLRKLRDIDYYYGKLEASTHTTLQHLLCSRNRQDFAYPGTQNDKLYKSTYRHKCPADRDCMACDSSSESKGEVCQLALESSCVQLGCDEVHTVTRSRLKEATTTTKPCFHFGRVACSDGVMKSAQDRDNIMQRYKVIGFEMEGAGVWDMFPTVIIKGVCDYADTHKNKLWQGYAAAVAVSSMKAFLGQWKTRTTPRDCQRVMQRLEERRWMGRDSK